MLAVGHARVGEVAGPGRPLDLSKPLAHAYVIVMLREFQAFARDLHDVAVQALVAASGVDEAFRPMLIEGITGGRNLDRGNATQAAIKSDFKRIGLVRLDVGEHNKRWSSGQAKDSTTFDTLLQLRNAVGHGNELALRSLINSGEAQDTVSWARGKRPVLNRYARALDRIVWDHLLESTGSEPW